MIRRALTILVLFTSTLSQTNISSTNTDLKWETETNQNFTMDIYHHLSVDTLPSFTLFSYAMKGYFKLFKENEIENSRYVTLIDFSLPSCAKRLWVIDLFTQKVEFHTYVSHGVNSGELIAKNFSNIPKSNMSSLGFYLTNEIYVGKHGLSLRLDGIEKNINHNARKRAIVMHPADYVSKAFINEYGRLGRSFGCPALPVETSDKIINLIAGKSLLFIYSNNKSYLTGSHVLNADKIVLLSESMQK